MFLAIGISLVVGIGLGWYGKGKFGSQASADAAAVKAAADKIAGK